MKHKKTSKKSLEPKLKDEIGDTIHHGKKKEEKIKYNHKSHWLEEEDDDYVPPKYKDEEE